MKMRNIIFSKNQSIKYYCDYMGIFIWCTKLRWKILIFLKKPVHKVTKNYLDILDKNIKRAMLWILMPKTVICSNQENMGPNICTKMCVCLIILLAFWLKLPTALYYQFEHIFGCEKSIMFLFCFGAKNIITYVIGQLPG